MSLPQGIVYVVDDEAGMRKALTRLLRAEGLEPRTFATAQEFLSAYQPGETACLILDVALPELGGMELQRRLKELRLRVPIIFLTGHGDIPMSVQAIKAGAVDFLTKPVNDVSLLHAVQTGLQLAEVWRKESNANESLAARHAHLTPREREVMAQVVAGKLNKQIAADFGTGQQNVKIHRGRVMVKMGVASLAELVRAAERLGVGPRPRV